VPVRQHSVTVRIISAYIALQFEVLWTVFIQNKPWFPTLLWSHLWTPKFCRIMRRPSQDQKWVRYECGTWCRQIQASSTLGGGDTSNMPFPLSRTGFCLRHKVPVLATLFKTYSLAARRFMQRSDSQKLLSTDQNIRHHNQQCYNLLNVLLCHLHWQQRLLVVRLLVVIRPLIFKWVTYEWIHSRYQNKFFKIPR
jgi:hypothetical protein